MLGRNEKAGKIGKAARAVKAVKAGKVGKAERAMRTGKAEGAGRDRLWVEYFSGFGRVIRCLYFGDCSVILRSS